MFYIKMEIIDCHIHIGEDIYSRKEGLLNIRGNRYNLSSLEI